MGELVAEKSDSVDALRGRGLECTGIAVELIVDAVAPNLLSVESADVRRSRLGPDAVR